MPHLRPVSVGDDHAPVHLKEVDDITHDTGKDLTGVASVVPRRLQGVAAESVDRCLSHGNSFAGTVLTLCTIYVNSPRILMLQEGDIHIGRTGGASW